MAEAAQHLGQPEIKIQAALRYYTAYRDEVDAWAQRMREIADAEERAFSASTSRPA